MSRASTLRRSRHRAAGVSIAAALASGASWAGLLLALGAAPGAHAQWFGTTEGQWFDRKGLIECLDQPDAPACRERLVSPPAPPVAPAPKEAAPAAAQPPAPPPPERTAKPAPPEPAPGLNGAIARLQADRAMPADMKLIEAKAIAGDRAAIEVLAWSYVVGRGHPADPVTAFRLYGLAAEIGVPNARQNQLAVFEHMMTGEQRQQVLDDENQRKAHQ